MATKRHRSINLNTAILATQRSHVPQIWTVAGHSETQVNLIQPDNDQNDTAATNRRVKRLNVEFHLGALSAPVQLMNFPEFVRIVRHRGAIVCYIAAISLYCVTNLDRLTNVPMWNRVAVYSAEVFTFMFFFGLFVRRKLARHRGADRPHVHLSPLILKSLGVCLVLHQLCFYVLTGALWDPVRIAATVLFYWFSSEVGMHLFWLFVLPRVLAELRGDTTVRTTKPFLRSFLAYLTSALSFGAGPRPPQPPPKTLVGDEITVLGTAIAPQSLRHIRAEGNYVVLRTDSGDIMILGRFAAAMGDIPDGLGRQVHRSHWVAQSAVVGFHTDRDEVRIELSDGTQVPVAGPRRADILPWLNAISRPLT